MHHAAPALVSPSALPDACLNCGESFGRRRARRLLFCPNCGQNTAVRPPTISEFVQQFGGAYLATERALWRSLKLLLSKPGELTVQYLGGRRKHYVLPLRLYLTLSLVALLLVRMVGGGSAGVKVDTAAIAKENSNLVIGLGWGRAGMRDGAFFCENLPSWACKRIQRRVDIDPDKVLSEVESVKDQFLGNLSGGMFVLLPGFALWLKLAYRNRHLRYTEHLVFALHLHAFWFLALILTLPGWGFLTTAVL